MQNASGGREGIIPSRTHLDGKPYGAEPPPQACLSVQGVRGG